MTDHTRYLLNESDLPKFWYNINADSPVPPTPVLHLGTLEHIKLYAEASKTPQGFQEYLDKYVYDVTDHWGYLEKVGGMRYLNNLLADPLLGY